MKEDAYDHYFLGIGGTGMAPLALYLAERGFRVGGQDRNLHEGVRRLLERGGVRVESWNPHRPVAGPLVLSSAIPQDHPLGQKSEEAGKAIRLRGELQAEMLEGKSVFAVGGSHGKTTTTALLGWAARRAGFPADYLVGGLFRDETPPARFDAEAAWVVTEVDESDGTLSHFAPEITLLMNLDWDHALQYPDVKALEETFTRLMMRSGEGVLVPEGGRLEALAREAGVGKVRTFGRVGDYRYELIVENATGMVLRLGGDFPAMEVHVPLWGSFNAENTAAALAGLHWMGLKPLPEAPFEGFPGLQRRQVCLHREKDREVWEDYAHHPTEIAAFLEMLRRQHPDEELLAVFQPHRYSRTRSLKKELAHSLSSADSVYLQPVYAASEPPDSEGSTDAFEAACREAGMVTESPGAGPELMRALDRYGPGRRTVAFIGAGDVTEQATAYVAWRRNPDDPAGAWESWVRDRVHPECRLEQKAPLHNKTTLRVGGTAACYAEPARYGDLRVLLRSAGHFGLPLFVLGRGSNLIVPDEGFSGLVLRFQHEFWKEIRPLDAHRLYVGAGVRLRDLAAQAARFELTGFEFMEGIPGSLGGSLRMNAGAMGSWMFDVVERVFLMSPEGSLADLDRKAFQVGYRSVEELKQGLAVGAILRSPGREATEAIRKRMQEFMLSRKATQPRDPSAGCIFKNPDGDAAGRLIDAAGLKGMRVGDAEVSTVHANFIVNRGSANSEDVIRLVRRVRSEVQRFHGVELEPEVLLMGRDWKEELKAE